MMAATLGQVARLRRMVAEPTVNNGYTYKVIKEAIERYPLPDADGLEPDADGWVATYDLNAAASEVWTEKAAARADNMDFNADGGSFRKQQQYDSAVKMARHYAARRMPSSIRVELVMETDEEAEEA